LGHAYIKSSTLFLQYQTYLPDFVYGYLEVQYFWRITEVSVRHILAVAPDHIWWL